MAARFSLRRFLSCESGATAVEYGLIVTVIFLAIVSSITFFTSNATTMFNNISSSVGAASS
ncbi:MAG TPA: Flp family type IVb pilin [Caulobacteraceae bacterium]